jgi:hypothetical protein
MVVELNISMVIRSVMMVIAFYGAFLVWRALFVDRRDDASSGLALGTLLCIAIGLILLGAALEKSLGGII